jgi:23S rRNA pseudouridine2605 synthase
VVDDGKLKELENGIYLDDGKTSPAKIKKIRKEEANSWLEITIHEGRKRQVRRMFDRIGHSVIKLKRIKTGNLSLGDLPEGSYRHLAPLEVRALKEASEKTNIEIQKPPAMSQKPETRSIVRKTAHKGKTLDLRPGRAVWSEERKQGPGATRSRVRGHGYRGAAPRQASKTEWSNSSSRSRVQESGAGDKVQGFRGQSRNSGGLKSRAGTKARGRRSFPKTMIQVERPTQKRPGPGPRKKHKNQPSSTQ